MTFIPNVNLNHLEEFLNNTFTDKEFLVESDRYGLNVRYCTKKKNLGVEEQDSFNDSVLDILFNKFGEFVYSYVYVSCIS